MKHAALAIALALAVSTSSAASAADKLRVVSSNYGFWDTTLIEFGKDKGIFAAEGIDVDLVFAQGGGSDVLQTVIAGGADVGFGTGTGGALAAVSKGAPIVIIGAEFTGSSDIFFYAKAGSPIKSFKDLDGRKLGISHTGSTTTSIASRLAAAQSASVDLVVTGGAAATITQVMTGQVDAGWSVYPIGIDKVTAGDLTIIASGNDAPGVSESNARVVVAEKRFAQENEALLRRFMKAYGKVLDWAYSTDEALTTYAGKHKLNLETARETVQRGYPREALETGRLASVDFTMESAVKSKTLREPLSKEAVADAFKLVPVINN